MKRSLTVGQIIGFNHLLTEYPMHLTFSQIGSLLKTADESVIVHEDFYDWDTEKIISFVESIAEDIDQEIALAMK